MKKFYVALSSNSLYEKTIAQNLCTGNPIPLFNGLLVYTKLSVAILNIHNLPFTKDTTIYEVVIEDQQLTPTPNAYCYLIHTASHITSLSSDDVIDILADELEVGSYPQAALDIIDANLRLTDEYDVCHDTLCNLLNPEQYTLSFYYLKRDDDILNPIVTEGVVSINPKDPESTMIPTTCSIIEALYAASVYGPDCKILRITPGSYGIGIYKYGGVDYKTFFIPNNFKRLKGSHDLLATEIATMIKELCPYLNPCLLHSLQPYVISNICISNCFYLADSIGGWNSFLNQHTIIGSVRYSEILCHYYKDILTYLTCDEVEKRSIISRCTCDEVLESDQMFLAVKDYIILGTRMLTEENEDCIVLTLIPKNNTNIIPRNLAYKCKDFYKAILSIARSYDALNFHIFFSTLESYEFTVSSIITTHVEEMKKVEFCDDVLRLICSNL